MPPSPFKDSIALFDASGRLVDWNDGFASEWKAAAEYLKLGTKYEILLCAATANPEAAQFLAMNFGAANVEDAVRQRIQSLGKTQEFEYRSADRIVKVRQQPTESGGTLRVAQDITDERQAADALASARHQLKAVDSDTYGVLTQSRRTPDGNYIFEPISEGLCRLLDLPLELVGQDPMLIYSRFEASAEDNARTAALMEHGAQTLETFSQEYRVRDGKDRMRSIRQSMMPRREADGTVIFSGVMRDVTREREAEDQLELMRSLVVRSSDSIVVFETEATPPHDARILYVNPRFEELFGFDAAAVMGRSSHVLQYDAATRATSKMLVDALRRGDGVPIEFEAHGRGGNVFWVEALVETVQKLDSGALRWVVISRDVSERRRVQVELLRAKEAAEAGNRAKSNFLANMSHELRTPLNAILGFTELIQQGVARNGWNDGYAEYFNDILDSGHHLLALINSVLDLSKIEAGSLALDLDQVDLEEVVRSSVEVVHGMAESEGITLRVNLPPDRLEITADHLKLKQVLLNILSNAIKFTPAGGVVTIEASATEKGAEIKVADTGCGISEADLERVLQPFVQVENSLSRRFPGSGLGLSIARELCALHGGRLDIASVEGEGTTVRIILPRG